MTFAAVKERLSIREVISEHTEVNDRGWASCTFHDDRSPSLKIDEEKELWYCFPCGMGGDCFTFIEKLYNVDRAGSLKILAEKAGIDLETSGASPELRQEIWEAQGRRRRRDLFSEWIEGTHNELLDNYRFLDQITHRKKPSDTTEDEWIDVLAPLYRDLTRAEAGSTVLEEGTIEDKFNYFLEMTT